MRYFTITFVKSPDGQINESTSVVRSLKNRDRDTANIILDFATKTVVKSRVDGELQTRDWQTVVDYYKKHYRDIFEQLEKAYK